MKYIGSWIIVFVLLTIFLTVNVVSAQDGSIIKIGQIETYDFPFISFLMETYDTDGNFITDLAPEKLMIYENGFGIEPLELELIDSGVQIILSINESPYLANRVDGTPHYERLMESIEKWISDQTAETKNDFSLATNTGLHAIRLENPTEWRDALASYEVNLLDTQSSLISLSQALELATDPDIDANKKRAILYITPLPNSTDMAALSNLTGQAVQLGVQVFVWLVAPTTYSDSEQLSPLVQLAKETGGEFFLYSGVEELPNINTYLLPLSYHYRVIYKSAIIRSGNQKILVQADSTTLQLSSNIENFDLNVSPPNPIFLAPPVNINREWVETDGENGETLFPDSVIVNVLIEFPDDYVRNIVRSQLFIDGELVVDITEEPFTKFIVDLKPYIDSGEHFLRVNVEDEIGLTGESIETLVYLVVEPPKPEIIGGLISERRLVISILIFIVVLVMTSILITSMRRPKGLYTVVRDVIGRKNTETHQRIEGLLQKGTYKSAAAQAETIPLPRRKFDAPARLVRVTFEGLINTQESILITQDEQSFGNDKTRVDHFLDSTSVAPIHARIEKNEDKIFLINDAGSISGTWVNYDQVFETGMKLKHGDLIFMGLVAFRFELRDPLNIPKLTVRPYNEEN